MVFSIYIISEHAEIAHRLVKCIFYSGLNENQDIYDRVSFKNKYFTAEFDVVYCGIEACYAQKPYGLIFLYSQGMKEKIRESKGIVEDSECCVLLDVYNDLQAEGIAEEVGVEFVQDDLDGFVTFRKEGSEMVGVGRVKEVLECAAAGFLGEQKGGEEKKTKKEVREENFEEDLDNFEGLIKKIKENCSKAKEVDDDSRRKNAEEAIKELMQYLHLSDEESED